MNSQRSFPKQSKHFNYQSNYFLALFLHLLYKNLAPNPSRWSTLTTSGLGLPNLNPWLLKLWKFLIWLSSVHPLFEWSKKLYCWWKSIQLWKMIWLKCKVTLGKHLWQIKKQNKSMALSREKNAEKRLEDINCHYSYVVGPWVILFSFFLTFLYFPNLL